MISYIKKQSPTYNNLDNTIYVCHFLDILTPEEDAMNFADEYGFQVNKKYEYALEKARKLWGVKYHNKTYGWGIAFNRPYQLSDF